MRWRFFSGFASAGKNLTCFRPLWHWCLDRLPSRPGGYTLDLDSTRLLHEDGHQEGGRTGYTRLGLKPWLHPLLAVISEVRVVAQLWLRAGNATCGNNTTAFFLDLWHNLPQRVRLRGVRADSGFCLPELLDLWEQLRLPYVVVAQLSEPIKNVLRGGLVWTATEVRERHRRRRAGRSNPELVATTTPDPHSPPRGRTPGRWREETHRTCRATCSKRWSRACRRANRRLAVWRYYNGRADCENVIKELQQCFALTILCLPSFWAPRRGPRPRDAHV